MKEFTKSLFSYSLALSFFGLKQFDNILRPSDRGERKGPATKSLDSVTSATTEQLGETLKSAFRAADNLQRGLVELTFSLMFPFGGGESRRRSDRGDSTAPAADPEISYSAEP